MVRFIIAVFVAAFSVMPSMGQTSDQTSKETSGWKMDKSHSQVGFSVAHLVISQLTGRFKDFEVTFQSTNGDFTDAKIEATIKTSSINTDNERRDAHLRSDDFLNAEKFPDIIFKSTSVEKTGKDTYRVNGDLTIRDITKPVVLETKLGGPMKTSRGEVVAFKATTTINRFDFGTKWNKAIEAGGLVAGENVDITLVVELNKAK